MYLGITLFVVGLAWLLNSIDAFSDQTFGLVGSIMIALAGLSRIVNMKRGRKGEDHF